MKTAQTTTLILGFSLAGLGAAITLREKGHNVVLCELLHDIPLRARSAVISPFDNTPEAGAAFEMVASERLRNCGSNVLDGEFELIDHHEVQGVGHIKLRALGCESLAVEANSVILAPNGVLPRTNYPAGWEQFIGHGVSESAYSDGIFYSGKPGLCPRMRLLGNGSGSYADAVGLHRDALM
jgi:thioredoxin reductase